MGFENKWSECLLQKLVTMKKTLMIPILLCALTFVSCKKDVASVNEKNDATVQANNDIAAKASAVFSTTCSEWHLATFRVNATDITNNYEGYNFTFCPDHTVAMSNDVLSYNGSWLLLLAKGGTSSYLQLDFDVPDSPTSKGGIVNMLEDMWVIVSMDDNQLLLQNQPGTEKLAFVRNSR